ncbi:MAG: cysteine desulfurase [Deltaproteobacteria bacterium]|nr:MAG: cysteine desulfurase [Deltaproteobacteria bacterium]
MVDVSTDNIYMDNAATSYPKPGEVIDAVCHHLSTLSSNPGRSAHRLSLEASRALFDARQTVADFFGASDSRDVVFTLNVTEALNLAIYGILRKGDHVVTTSMEHNSVMRPLRHLESEGIIELSVVHSFPDGSVDIDGIAKRVKQRKTRLLVVNHASNVTGTIADIKAISRVKGEALLLVDAAQTAGCLPIDLKEMGIDLLAFTGHKALLGPQGTGGLVINTTRECILPLKRGGTGSNSEFEQQPDFLPDRLESGTANGCGIAGLARGIEVIQTMGIDNIRMHEKKLIEIMQEGLKEIKGIRIYGPMDAERQVAVISINIEGISPSDVGYALDRSFNICVRTGLHCAPSAHRTIGSFPQGTVRFSMGIYNTEDDVEKAIDALTWIAEH